MGMLGGIPPNTQRLSCIQIGSIFYGDHLKVLLTKKWFQFKGFDPQKKNSEPPSVTTEEHGWRSG